MSEPAWTPFEEGVLPPRPDIPGAPPPDLVLINSRYQVNIVGLAGGWLRLSIKRRDKRAVHDWRDLQRIKNEVAGPEREAIELYPAEGRLVDSANQYWLFVLPAGKRVPVGFNERFVSEDESLGSRQRPFEQRPPDLRTAAEYLAGHGKGAPGVG